MSWQIMGIHIFPNSNINSEGRFGNQFFRNMASHFIAKRHNLKYTYCGSEYFKMMGIYFFENGTNFYPETNTILTDQNFMNYITSDEDQYKPENMKTNISMHLIFCQTPEFTKYLKDYFNEPVNKLKIINANPFKELYNATFANGNNDLFVHVRLGDVPQHSPGYDYYDKLIGSLKFDKGYIASDSIGNEICKKLIEKYKLQIFNGNEIQIVQFASTCKYLVLSNGTFSWMMAFFAYFTQYIYYPKMKNIWHGDIYTGFDNWKCVDW